MDYQKSKEHFRSADGRTDAACYFYEPAFPPVGVVQISHGMCEYLERYEDFAAFLCQKGFVVCGSDHLGHGATASGPEELGYFGEKPGGAVLLPEDLHAVTRLAKERFPGLPFFLLGHSMGSFAARRYLALYGDELDGAVICGTAGPNPAAGAGRRIAALLTAAGRGKRRSHFLNNLAFSSYNRRFDAPKSRYAWLSRDEAIVRKYEQDPLCTFIFTTAGFRDLFALLESVSSPKWAASVPKDLPVLLISGEDDPVGDYGKGVRRVACMLEKAGLRDLCCRLYPGCRHEILNETNRSEVYRDVWQWLRRAAENTAPQ